MTPREEIRAAAAQAAATFLAGRRCEKHVVAELIKWFEKYIYQGFTKE